MRTAQILLALMWVGVTAYALMGGADFGAGFWDLVAGGPERGSAQRKLIEHAIGPVWEANHVWLIFVLVVLWTGFPEAFAAIASSLYVPLTLVAVGVILRGAGFAFRKAVTGVALERFFGATFAASSVITPFFLGAVAGAVASGRVPAGIARAHPIHSFVNPTSVLGGALAVVVCAYLAAVYLTADAGRAGDSPLAEAFRRRALVAGLAAGGLTLGGIAVLHADAPDLFAGLTGRGWPLVAASAVTGLVSIGCVWGRRFVAARLTAAAAVTAVLWGWAAGQYPYVLEGELTIRQAAADPVALRAVLLTLAVGALLVVPALVALLTVARQDAVRD
ncbi:MAG TPA: cytochrome d ubiquinol oxidase subunit II [Acidimicrobiia bacterium]|jgi:cytochrome d ubiquinol oxidase subunit II|nr:cytochrome d ubiquinol oxidase subunit II [Acidimicrobiia bacterium]